MNDYNTTTLLGRVSNDGNLTTTPSGTSVFKFTLAVNKSRKVESGYQDEVSFFNINTYGKMADYLKSKIKKGDRVLVGGELKQDRWEKNGNKYSSVVINATSCIIVDTKETKNDEKNAPENFKGFEGWDNLPF